MTHATTTVQYNNAQPEQEFLKFCYMFWSYIKSDSNRATNTTRTYSGLDCVCLEYVRLMGFPPSPGSLALGDGSLLAI